ncbi:MAG: hypothetical protein V3T07_00485 [Myxococcota bacterium]
MAEALARRPGLPWSLRLFEAAPRQPLWVALGIACAYVLVWGAWFRVFEGYSGVQAVWGPGGWSETIIRGLLLGYTPALVWIGRRATARDLHALRPALQLSDGEFAALREKMMSIDRRALRLAGSVGAVANVVILANAPDLFNPLGRWPEAPAGVLWDFGWMAGLGWLVFRALAHDLRMARALSRIGEREASLDLLDMRPLAPLNRWGLRTVLLWAIWFAIISLFWVGPVTNLGNALGVLPLLVVTVAALLLPVNGLRRRVRARKREELAQVGEEIRRLRDEGIGVEPGDARLANWIAYRSLIEAVHEWPFDVSTLLRFSLYVMLGAGSWLGAALVERVLDRALG